jgi:hypothetical protein
MKSATFLVVIVVKDESQLFFWKSITIARNQSLFSLHLFKGKINYQNKENILIIN